MIKTCSRLSQQSSLESSNYFHIVGGKESTVISSIPYSLNPSNKDLLSLKEDKEEEEILLNNKEISNEKENESKNKDNKESQNPAEQKVKIDVIAINQENDKREAQLEKNLTNSSKLMKNPNTKSSLLSMRKLSEVVTKKHKLYSNENSLIKFPDGSKCFFFNIKWFKLMMMT